MHGASDCAFQVSYAEGWSLPIQADQQNSSSNRSRRTADGTLVFCALHLLPDIEMSRRDLYGRSRQRPVSQQRPCGLAGRKCYPRDLDTSLEKGEDVL